MITAAVRPTSTKATTVEFFPASDRTLLVLLERCDGAEFEVNEEVLALAHHLRQDSESGILNLHPAYSTLLIRFDPLLASHAEIEAFVRERLQSEPHDLPNKKHVDVPVCYGGAFGPDLEAVAQFANLTPAQVVEIHSA